MVYFMENSIKMDDDWRYPYVRKPPRMAANVMKFLRISNKKS